MTAALATIAALASLLLFLVSVLTSGAFAGRVPSGNSAVGLVVPLFGSIAAALLLLVASGLALSVHRLDWVGPRSGAWVLLLALGIGGAAVVALLAWMEKLGPWVTPVGLLAGGLAPLLAGGILLLSLWAPERLVGAHWPKLIGIVLILSVVLGAGTTWALLTKVWRRQRENAQRVQATTGAAEMEQERRRALSPLEKLREEFAAHSAETPLWVYVARLPDIDDAAVRAFIIERALKVPGFDQALERTITDENPRYRHGAIELLLYVDAPSIQASWAPLLANSILVSAREMTAQSGWLVPNTLSNPDPSRHIRSMITAAERLGPTPQLTGAVAQLKQAMATLAKDPQPTRNH